MYPISILTVDLNLSKGNTEQKKGQTDGWMDRRMDGGTDGRTDEQTNVWLDKCQVGQTLRSDKHRGWTNVEVGQTSRSDKCHFLAFGRTNVRSDKC